MNLLKEVDYKLTDVGKFYFLEYFYILLRCISSSTNNKIDAVFDSFKELKDLSQLGESKYKKISVFEEPTGKRLGRYKYTFNQIVEEAKLYGLVTTSENTIQITSMGSELQLLYSKNPKEFYEKLFELIERKLNGFHYLISKSYEADYKKGGLLIFPIYSPLKLGIAKSDIRSNQDLISYIKVLTQRLKADSLKLIDRNLDLTDGENSLIQRLTEVGLISEDLTQKFESKNYNLIIKRIRDFWLNYFLRNIYNMQLSISYFDIWTHRGKQLGIINITEFYPNFDGKIVYPTSILSQQAISNKDFRLLYEYPNGESLYLHEPDVNDEKSMDDFVSKLYESYLDLRSVYKSLFINLADLRDVVCYKYRISSITFIDFLQKAYTLNLHNSLRIAISLEADKLPEETQAAYMTREPILIDNKYRNIISINLKTHG